MHGAIMERKKEKKHSRGYKENCIQVEECIHIFVVYNKTYFGYKNINIFYLLFIYYLLYKSNINNK